MVECQHGLADQSPQLEIRTPQWLGLAGAPDPWGQG